MKKELEFLEQLRKLQSKAEENQRHITKQDVQKFAQENALGEEQMNSVYAYLQAQGIRIEGMENVSVNEEKKDKIQLTEAEANYLKEYRNDMSYIKDEKPGEKEELFQKALEGDALAKARLIELYMPVVVEIALEMNVADVYLGDLVQEGNVSLMLALEMLSVKNQDDMIKDEIRSGMQALIAEQTDAKKRDNILVEKVNNLDETIQTMKKDKGREITIDELSEYLKISDEEILDLIKLAGEELDSPEDGSEEK